MLCVIAEQNQDGQPIIFTAFDAIEGRGAELTRFETKEGGGYNWAVSPDGTRIAVLATSGEKSRSHKSTFSLWMAMQRETLESRVGTTCRGYFGRLTGGGLHQLTRGKVGFCSM